MHDMMDQLVSGSGHAAVWSSTGSGQRCWEQSGRCGLHWGCSSGRVVVGRHVLSLEKRGSTGSAGPGQDGSAWWSRR